MIESADHGGDQPESGFLTYTRISIATWEQRNELMAAMQEAVQRGDMVSEQMPSNGKAVVEYRDRIANEMSALLGANDVERNHLEIIYDELLVNAAVTHGNERNEQLMVDIKWGRMADAVVGYVGDQGEGFDPRKIVDPTLEENLDKACGRGIMLTDSLYLKVVNGKGLYLPIDMTSELCREFVFEMRPQES